MAFEWDLILLNVKLENTNWCPINERL